MIEQTQDRLTHLGGSFWWASRQRFMFPGIYFNSTRICPLPRLIKEPELIPFPEQTIVIAKNQPQYRPLPAHKRDGDVHGEIVCCWKLTFPARIKLLFTGVLWHSIWTFDHPLQPQLLLHTKPVMKD